MWPFNQKTKSPTDFSDYISTEMILEAAHVQLNHNEKVAVDFGLGELKGRSVHPEVTELLKAIIAGSLFAYAVYLIRKIPSFAPPPDEIEQAYDKAFSIYPNRAIFEDKARFYGAMHKFDEQKKVQTFLHSKPQSKSELDVVFDGVVTTVLLCLENTEVASE